MMMMIGCGYAEAGVITSHGSALVEPGFNEDSASQDQLEV
jgi:hypothetical protein